MPWTARLSQVLLLLPPLATAGLLCLGDDPLRTVPIPGVVVVFAGAVAVLVGHRSNRGRRLAVVVGWLWIVAALAATAAGMVFVSAYGLGCLILAFVALPLLLCGFGLVTATTSDGLRAWCRPGGRL